MNGMSRVDMMPKDQSDALGRLVRAADSLLAGLLDEVTVEPESPDSEFWGHTTSDLQTNVVVEGDVITGTLHYVASGTLATDWGPGYFIVLKFADPDASATSVKVGLDPSQGSGLVELDEDMNGVFKITDKNAQKFKVVSTDGTRSTVQTFDLSKLVMQYD